MAGEGAEFTICYLPEEQEDADWSLEQIRKAGRKGHGTALNLRDDGSCKKAVEEHMQIHGKINVLVNNASMQEVCKDHADIDMDVVQKDLPDQHQPDDADEQVRPKAYEEGRIHN